ncbi:ubiquinol-cytochrome-c reductase complex assembly factor 6 [Topomyia yanbarensis]|uniref:ubiquinol-cytochrome-c reductase complex assembly factor 6 n=1 Tax=Topomyia yanbarensis TaxID=2498891 RepID=UPI00273C0AEE|nr:ubiquinol-cytochrome-c reductase complex assembly factor 6 [Topomyia yanbarensis]
MPAGVSTKEYVKFMAAAFLAMFAGSQVVHIYYKPLKDLDHFVKKEIMTQHLREVKNPDT